MASPSLLPAEHWSCSVVALLFLGTIYLLAAFLAPLIIGREFVATQRQRLAARRDRRRKPQPEQPAALSTSGS